MVLYIAVGDTMILYRGMLLDEYEKIRDGKVFPRYDDNIANVDNSFTYKDGDPCMHFFKNIEYAKRYLYCFGEMIVKCNMPDNLIEESGYGFYGRKKYSVYIPIPEYIVKRSNFSLDYIEEINPSIRKNYNYILGVRETKLYDRVIKELYEEWVREHEYYGKRDFCLYVVKYFQLHNLEDILNKNASEYNESKGLIRLRKR